MSSLPPAIGSLRASAIAARGLRAGTRETCGAARSAAFGRHAPARWQQLGEIDCALQLGDAMRRADGRGITILVKSSPLE